MTRIEFPKCGLCESDEARECAVCLKFYCYSCTRVSYIETVGAEDVYICTHEETVGNKKDR